MNPFAYKMSHHSEKYPHDYPQFQLLYTQMPCSVKLTVQVLTFQNRPTASLDLVSKDSLSERNSWVSWQATTK